MKKGSFFYRLVCGSTLALGSMYAFNRFSDLYAGRKHLLHSKPENFFNWKGIRIYYECKGSGEPVLLLHAIHPAASSFEWSDIIDRLSHNHQVYAIDLPGCGISSKEKLPYSNFVYVELIRDFIHQMAISHPIVVASNLTCAVAVMASAYDPSLFKKMVLISPPTPSSLAEAPDITSNITRFILELPIIGTFIYNITTTRSRIDLAFTEQYFYNPFHDNDDLVDTYYESAHLDRGRGHFLAACIVGRLLNIDISRAVQNLKIPVCLIYGSDSGDADRMIREWSDLNAEIRIEKIEHTRQLPHLEEPNLTSQIIDSFSADSCNRTADDCQ